MNESYQLCLFVAGSEPNSLLARKNLGQICEQYLDGRYNIKVVDVLLDFESAIEEGILVTPTLVLTAPEPKVTILGNLSDTTKVLNALRLVEFEHESR